MSYEDDWDFDEDENGNAIIPGAEDEPDSVFPDPEFCEPWLGVDSLTGLIRSTWPPEGPWNAVRTARIMLAEGFIPVPAGGLTKDQIEIFGRTHELMCSAAADVNKAVVGADLNPEIWKLLLRGGVCERLVSAPGETGTIKVINAMRGERKAWPTRRTERLWEQLSYPAGIADAALVLLGRLTWPELEPYRAALLAAIPKLRRCRKLTQERRR